MIDHIQKEVKFRFSFRKKSSSRVLDELLKEANQAFLSQDLDSVIYFSLEILKLYPSCIEAYNLLSLVYEDKGETNKAIDFLFLKLQMRKTGGIDKEEWLDVGHKYFSISEFQSASYCCQRALKLKPKWLPALELKVMCYEKLDNEKGMITFLERFVENGGISNKQMIEKLAKLYNLQSKGNVKN